MIWAITLTIQDAKAQTSRWLLYVESGALILEEAASPFEYARAVAAALDPLIDGSIIGAWCSAAIPLPGGLKSAPLDHSDVEQGLNVTYGTASNFRFRHRIPTWSETYLNDDGTVTDDVAVSDFFHLLTDPADAAADWQIGPTDARGDDLVIVLMTKENFKASRA